jgi:hypothetical protein
MCNPDGFDLDRHRLNHYLYVRVRVGIDTYIHPVGLKCKYRLKISRS